MTEGWLTSLDALCVDPFWNQSQLMSEAWPHFSACFRHSALSWPAHVFLLVTLPVYLLVLRSRSEGNSHFSFSLQFVLKEIGSTSLAALSLLLLAKNVLSDSEEATAYIVLISDALRTTGFLCACLLMVYERHHGEVASGPLYFFWITLTATETVWFYQRIMYKEYDTDPINFVFDALIYGLIVLEFVFSFFVDVDRKEGMEKGKKPWPETSSSLPSRMYYWWMASTVFRAWKRPLTEADIYDLPPSSKGEHVVPEFNRVWQKINARRLLRTSKGDNSGEHTPGRYMNSAYSINKQRTRFGDGPSNGTPASEHQSDHDKASSSNGVTQPRDHAPHSSQSDGRDREIDSKEEEPPFTLMKVLVRLFGRRYSMGFLLKMLSDCLTVAQPMLVREIIKTVQGNSDSRRPRWIGIVLCICLALLQLLKSVLVQYSLYLSGKIGLEMKSSLMAAILQKGLRMSSGARKKYTAGEIMTVMSVDTQRVQEVWRIVVLLAGLPIQVGVSFVLLYQLIGVSAIAGLVLLLVIVPVNNLISIYLRKVQTANMILKQKRIKLTTDVLSGIKVLKLQAWERSFADQISAIRCQEMKNLSRLAHVRIIMMLTNWTIPFLVSLATFVTYILISEENTLDAATAFTAVAYFAVMRAPLAITTFVITGLVMSTVSLKRINKFLLGDDLDDDAVGTNTKPGSAISVEDATLSWVENSKPVLTKVNLEVAKKSLTMLVGRVGSGKSSLLSGILCEMKLVSGQVNVKGSIAYVAQQAWIQNATLRDNILFGSKMDSNRYWKVVKACALERDLKSLPSGDETEIGEKGVNLSGGQKQRIALARAVYSDQEVFLMDDPLSAVDAHVGKHIFQQVIGPDGLLKDKTRLLVTHGAHWLPHADTVVMMEAGQVLTSGAFQDLVTKSEEFVQLIQQETQDQDDDGVDEDDDDGDVDSAADEEDEEAEEQDPDEEAAVFEGNIVVLKSGLVEGKDGATTSYGMQKGDIPLTRRSSKKRKASMKKKNKKPRKKELMLEADKGKIIETEKMAQGKVKLKIIFAWLKAGGLFGVLAFYSLAIAYEATSSGSGFWLQYWTSDPYLNNLTLKNTTEFGDKNVFYLGIYGAFGAGQILFFVLNALFYWRAAVRASRILHDRMLASVLMSPMEFFDTTPMGRVLNRFSSDVDSMDSTLPQVFVDAVNTFNHILATVVVVCINVPMFTIAAVPIIIIIFVIERIYLPAVRQLKRMESVSKSPIYSQFGEAVGGASTIRAFGHTPRFQREALDHVDRHVVRNLTLYSCAGWLGILLGMIGCLFTFLVNILAVTSDSISGGQIGLSVTYTLDLILFLNGFVRQQADFTSNAVSVERVIDYSSLQPEGLMSENLRIVPSSWPASGLIEFRNLEVRYREHLETVLKGINARIESGEKVGIVGRTGAGKSSLTLTLFRILEASRGVIEIDGVNIAEIELTALRSKISILPQDPVLFAGSLRMNLDPTGEHSDRDIMSSLEQSHLLPYIQHQAQGLELDVGEEGCNLSAGQRQLVCLARALLRKNKILVLDEATAAVDIQTDALIQRTIRTAFKDCTVITIAHRINTVLDYDRVMVLEEGIIREFASPRELLNRPESLFYQLASEANLV